MKIKSECGVTEVSFESFVAIEPKCEQVRESYRKACAERPDDAEKHRLAVLNWAGQHFGLARYHRDFDAAVGGAQNNTALHLWWKWLGSQPPGQHKAYYDPRIVAACIMGDD